MTLTLNHPRQQQARVIDGHRSVEDFIATVTPERAGPLADYHKANLTRFNTAKGSGTKHQAWPGGYRDHVTQMLNMAYRISNSLEALYGKLPFPWESVVVAVYFHDVEKTWKHVPEALLVDPVPDKYEHLDRELPRFGLFLTEDERNAIRFAHGEPEELYNKTDRVMGRLAALVHSCDMLSARLTFDLDTESTFKEKN